MEQKGRYFNITQLEFHRKPAEERINQLLPLINKLIFDIYLTLIEYI